MSEQKMSTVYFDKPGPANTDRVMEIVLERAKALGVETVLVATTSGKTGLIAAKSLTGIRTVSVTHSTGFPGPNMQELTPENKAAIEQAGGVVLTCQHAFGGVNRAIRTKMNTYQVDEVVAFVYRTLGQGFKVCVELALMAADAGLVKVGEPCISIGGTGRGADTALVLTPANAQTFFDLRVHEVLCKPYL